MVELVRDDGGSLVVGLGRDLAVLSFNPSADPPYFASLGDPAAAGSLWFQYFGSPSEFPASQGVQIDAAIDAMKRYLESGATPANIGWTQA